MFLPKSLDAIINTTKSNYMEQGHHYQSFQDGKAVVGLTFFVVSHKISIYQLMFLLIAKKSWEIVKYNVILIPINSSIFISSVQLILS